MTDQAPAGGDWIGRRVLDRRGEQIGDITSIYHDDRTGRPEWMRLSARRFGSVSPFVPIAGTTVEGGDLKVEFDQELIEGAPDVDVVEGVLGEEDERRLYRHYGFDADAADPEIMY